MTVAATLLSLVLAGAFLAAGVPKLRRTPHYRDRARHWRLPDGALPVIGLAELATGTLLGGGAVTGHRELSIAGAALAVATMLGAVLTHVRIADPPRAAAPAAVLGALGLLELVLTR